MSPLAPTAQDRHVGIGFPSALLLLFVGLKLGHVIDWSWWWVLSPALIPFGIAGVVLVALGVVWLYMVLAEMVRGRP